MRPATAAAMASAASHPWPELTAEPSWRTVDFISDLHLHAGEPENFLAWQSYIEHTSAQAVFILGDLFEVWVGDDAIGPVAGTPSPADGFEDRCAQTMLRASSRCAVFLMCGNRDFLLGEPFARACGVKLLHDPTTLVFAGQRWLLSHGDALCLADTDYMQFRALVRSPAWQQEFLARPLAQRWAIARDLRAGSEARKRSQAALIDVDAPAAARWLECAEAMCLIHGHTHRAADHLLGGDLRRIVLSDWDQCASPPRAQVLRVVAASNGQAARIQRIAPQAA